MSLPNYQLLSQWMPVSGPRPGDGDSIWITVVEWDGVNRHVDYAEAWVDVDGLVLHRYESETKDYAEPWPPANATHWMPATKPPLPIGKA